jgi:alpha/beta superfamily hydrolase
MYISGTHPQVQQGRTSDYMTDLAIPIGQLKNTQRYIDAEYYLNLRPETRLIVSHSLGSAVATELLRRRPNISGRLYASPNIYGLQRQNVQYFRHHFDPISGLNMMGNLKQNTRLNVHGFEGY